MDSSGIGRFTLYVKQLYNNEIEVKDKERAANSLTAEIPSTPEETVQEVKKEAVVSSVLSLKKKNPKITDKLAKRDKIPDNNNITVVKYGEQFTRDGRRKVLKPNVQYSTPEGYTYKTDELGRIVSCEETLKKGKSKRKPNAQRKVGGKDRKPNDEGGSFNSNNI